LKHVVAELSDDVRSTGKKCWLTITIMILTTSIYMGSSIWAPAIEEGAEYFHVGLVPSTLGISLFVLGYATGPLFLSPITEIPAVGRTSPYIITLSSYCVLQVPTALCTNFAGFCVLRFLSGFVGSPPLATGGERAVTLIMFLTDVPRRIP
jgi:DHA1 family multidrug resistance protein-like MFS transporter